MRVSAFAGLTLSLGAFSAFFLGFFNLRSPQGFGQPVTVPKIQIPEPGGEPVRITEGKFWLVNLDGAEGDVLEPGRHGRTAGAVLEVPAPGLHDPLEGRLRRRRGGVPRHPGLVPLPLPRLDLLAGGGARLRTGAAPDGYLPADDEQRRLRHGKHAGPFPRRGRDT